VCTWIHCCHWTPLISHCGNQPSISTLVPLIASVSSVSVATKSARVAAFLLLPQVMSAGMPSSCCKAIKILVSAGGPTRVYISVPDAIAIHSVRIGDGM